MTAKKVRELDEAIQNVLVTSAKAGLEPAEIGAAVADLTAERDALRRHMAMIEAWRAESHRESQRMRRLWDLAEHASKRLPQMTPEEQKEIYDLLDIRVSIVEQRTRTRVTDERARDPLLREPVIDDPRGLVAPDHADQRRHPAQGLEEFPIRVLSGRHNALAGLQGADRTIRPDELANAGMAASEVDSPDAR